MHAAKPRLGQSTVAHLLKHHFRPPVCRVPYDFFFILLYDAKPKIRSPRGLYHPSSFQFNVLSANMLEQSETFTEQYGHYANLYFVKQSSFYELLSGIRAAYYRDIFVTCSCFGLFNSTFNTISDEGKR
jgi:hypothetical protein